MVNAKIKELEELKEILEKHKSQGKKIVQCHGCFDIVHYGHLQHFLNSKKQGDILVVTVTPDRFIKKGPGRPFFNENIRVEHLSELECIDYIALNKWETAVEAIRMLKPNVYSKGKEVLENKSIDEVVSGSGKKSNLAAEIEALNSVGGKLHLTDEVTFSSSSILNKIASLVSEESKKFIEELKKNYSSDDIINILESLKGLRVLVIGDTIIDEYVFCNVLDKSGKEPIVAYKFLNEETYAGGVLALANNLANFTDNVSLVTCAGNKSYEFIELRLNRTIERNIFIQKDSVTLIKRRYLDNYKKIKMFEVYNTEGLNINEETESKIIKFLDTNLHRFDLIIAADFGHGLISPKLINYLCECNKFLAVNCQLNAGNFGYNFITKYKQASFVSLNNRELRLPLQDKDEDIRMPIKKLSEKMNLNKINITLGKAGSVYFQDGKYNFVPAFTQETVDTIGAGDAVLGLTSLLVYKEINPVIIPFLGNCIGALATQIIGNKEQVTLIDMKKFISYLMR